MFGSTDSVHPLGFAMVLEIEIEILLRVERDEGQREKIKKD